jgi:hypothetical protein
MGKEAVRTSVNLKSEMYKRVLRHGRKIGSHSLTETIRDLLNKGLIFHRQLAGKLTGNNKKIQ